jgi:hypothetical protein
MRLGEIALHEFSVFRLTKGIVFGSVLTTFDVAVDDLAQLLEVDALGYLAGARCPKISLARPCLLGLLE